MIYRRERPRIRKDIETWLHNRGWTLDQLKDHVEGNPHRFRSSFKAQLHKMIEEQRSRDYFHNMEYEQVHGQKIPVVYVIKKDGHFVFWCPYCKRDHVHSLPHLGFRHCHCKGNLSPFKHGYFLKLERGDIVE